MISVGINFYVVLNDDKLWYVKKELKLFIESFSEIITQKASAKYLKKEVYLRYIQTLPGHKTSKTTEIYTSVNRVILTDIKNLPDSISKGETNMIASRGIRMHNTIPSNWKDIHIPDINDLGEIDMVAYQ